MVVEKGHRIKNAARQMQKPHGKRKIRTANVKFRAAFTTIALTNPACMPCMPYLLLQPRM